MPEPEETPLQRIQRAEQAQPSLWPDPDDVAAGAGDKWSVGQFTGERLASADPERYRAIVRALANGMSIRSIARVYRVSANTVAAVRAREGSTIDTVKQELAGLATLGATMAVERIVEEIDSFKRESLPIVAGVLIDKAQLLTGQATSIIQRAEGPAGWEDALSAIRQAKGKTVDTAGTGLDLESAGTKGAPASLPAPSADPSPWPAGLPVRSPDYAGTRDSESPDYSSNHGLSGAGGNAGGNEPAARHGHQATDHGPAASPAAQGGRGSDARAGQEPPMSSPLGNFEPKETP